MLVKEGGVQLLLTIVDTPGFGDAVDNSNWYAKFDDNSILAPINALILAHLTAISAHSLRAGFQEVASIFGSMCVGLFPPCGCVYRAAGSRSSTT